MSNIKKIDSEEDLLQNVIEFNKHITQAREEKVVAGRSEYFVHLKSDSEDMFAPSKFCFIKDISIERYVDIRAEKKPSKKQNKKNGFDGETAQKHIKEKIPNKEWTSFNDKSLSKNTKDAFKNWIRPFFKTEKKLEKIHLITIFDKGSFFPEELNDESGIPEGAKSRITVNKYERSRDARNKCIEFHGYTCKICQFDFEKVYGEIGKEFIHVHHIIPLHIHTIKDSYKINPINDLIPVCPNCHAMLHRKVNGKEPTIEELKLMINKENVVAWASNLE